MMKEMNEIEKLYYLNEEEIFKRIGNSKQYRIDSKKAEEIEQVLRNCSCEDNQKQLSNCIDSHNEKAVTMMKETFKFAFSLANRLIIESLKN